MATTTPVRRTLDDDDTDGGPDRRRARAEVVRWALVGTLLLLTLVFVDVRRNGGSNPLSLIQPATGGPAVGVIEADFPEVELPAGLGLDGQMYYAVARDPLHLDETADHLDAPRYRLQRPLLSWAAWGLQPTGGGDGLVLALFAVGAVGIFVGALATGLLSTWFRGPPWAAALFPLLPGAYWSLRVTVSDALALGLALAALAAAARTRHGWAVALGVLAVLAKEPAVLVLLGWAVHRRTRRDTAVVVVPALVAGAWMLWLRIQFPADPVRSSDLGPPFVGLVDAWRDQWSTGDELLGMACTVGGLVLAAVALRRRGLRHPLGWAIAIQVAFLLVMGLNPTAMTFGATRMSMPVMALSLLALLTPRAAVDDDPPAAPAPGSAVAPGRGVGSLAG